MRFKARLIDFETGGKPILILNQQDAESLGLHASDRVRVRCRGKEIIGLLDTTKKLAQPGMAIINDEINAFLKIRPGDEIEVIPAGTPESVMYIKEKIQKGRLDYPKIKAIVEDVVEKHLSDIEMTAFVTALDIHGINMAENEALSRAMIETGKTLKLSDKMLVDKHSIGGCAGDKTSMIFVPIVSACGLTIAKTSSRAITSPAGTADRMEVLAPVEFRLEDIKRIVKRVGACLVWGGALDLSPADDAFIQIEYPLGIDPLLLPSIMSKKKAVGSKYLVVDIPTGRGAKIKTVGEATSLSNDFIELGKRLGIETACGITYGEQPIGYGIGPALEAREALMTLQGKGPSDVIEKVTQLCGILFEMVGKNSGSGKEYALKILKSGKAYKKMQAIIDAQGGNPKVKISDIAVGSKRAVVKSETDGFVLWTKNAEIAAIAREAGAPKDKGAGILIGKKNGDRVKKGETLFTIYSNSNTNLNSALKLAEAYDPIVVGKSFSEKMLLSKVPTRIPHRKIFMLER